MANRHDLTSAELKLLGLMGRTVEGILDTPEKARELQEQVKNEIEPELRKLDKATRESQAKASRYIILRRLPRECGSPTTRSYSLAGRLTI